MATETVTRKSRNLGIAGHASPTSDYPSGYHFAPNDRPEYTGGCAAIRRGLAEYRRIWSGGTSYRVDLFVGGKRVAHDDGSFDKLRAFCLDSPDPEYGYIDQSVTVSLED